MKKIVLAIVTIAAIIILLSSDYSSGHPCALLIGRAQSNTVSHSFEGFTGENTIADVYANTANKLTGAGIFGSIELLGYPSAAEYKFTDAGGRQVLCGMEFTLYPRGAESREDAKADILGKLNAALSGSAGSTKMWDTGRQLTGVRFYDEGELAKITTYDTGLGGSFQDIDIFPCSLGEDLAAVYYAIKGRELPEGSEARQHSVPFSYLEWEDGGMQISMLFHTGETGSVNPYFGTYIIPLKHMKPGESVELLESLADGLKAVMGAPGKREYKTATGQVLSAQDIKNSAEIIYLLKMGWPGMSIDAVYGNEIFQIAAKFDKRYFTQTNEK